MATMIPSTVSPECKSDAERKIFRWFRDNQYTDEWYVLHSLNIEEHVALVHGETDFLVLAPHKGIFALEVKGGSIKRTNGEWVFTDRHGRSNSKTRGPFEQAEDGIHSIMRFIAKNVDAAHQYLKDLLFGSGVMFPDVDFSYTGIDADKDQVFDINDGENVAGFIDRLFMRTKKNWGSLHPGKNLNGRLPTAEDVRYLAGLLRGDFEFVIPVSVQLKQTNDSILRLTKEQYSCLDQLEDNKRCLITGGAGAGKTFLAMELYRRCMEAGERVALFCYNKSLGDWLASKVKLHCDSFVGTLHSFMRQVVKEAGCDLNIESFEFWEHALPQKTVEILKESSARFDRIIVDEAQDLITKEYLDVMDALLTKGIGLGKWCMFGDFSMQSIYTGEKSASQLTDTLDERTAYARFKLSHNLRSTRQICDAVCIVSGFQPEKEPWAYTDGMPVDWQTWNTEEEEAAKLSNILYSLKNEGIFPGDITILSPRDREHSVVNTLSGFVIRNYNPGQQNEITFSTIRRFKGLENDVIIIADAEDYSDEKLSYVALSRAKAKLYVLQSMRANAEYVERFIRRINK